MNKNELRTAIKDAIMTDFHNAFPNAIQIDDYKFAIPVGNIDGEGEKYVKVDITAAQWYDTATVEAFNPKTAVEAYEQKIADRDANKAKREAEKASKKPKAKAKKKSEDDE